MPEGATHYFYKKATSLPGMHRGRNQGAGGATAPQYFATVYIKELTVIKD